MHRAALLLPAVLTACGAPQTLFENRPETIEQYCPHTASVPRTSAEFRLDPAESSAVVTLSSGLERRYALVGALSFDDPCGDGTCDLAVHAGRACLSNDGCLVDDDYTALQLCQAIALPRAGAKFAIEKVPYRVSFRTGDPGASEDFDTGVMETIFEASVEWADSTLRASGQFVRAETGTLTRWNIVARPAPEP